jgi:hypothetical protein
MTQQLFEWESSRFCSIDVIGSHSPSSLSNRLEGYLRAFIAYMRAARTQPKQLVFAKHCTELADGMVSDRQLRWQSKGRKL